MSALKPVMQVIGSHPISNQLLESDPDKFGGLITNGQYAWFAYGAEITLYSKQLGSVISSRSFATNQKDKSLKITFVKELSNCEETCNFILVGCSFKSSGILFICQLPTLTTIRCIELPNAISYISTIINKPLAEDQLCDEFNVMSTVLLVGLATGAAYAIDLRQNHMEQQLRRNEIVINEARPSKIFIVRKNEDCQEVKEMSDHSDSHLAMFINENFYAYCKKQYSGKLNLKVSSLLYIEEINTIAIGYSTGHYQLWDCKIMRTICLLKEPKCVMPVTHISFMEPSDDPNNLCYLWVIQSDNSKLPNATMIALTYETRTVMPNGRLSYRVFKGNGVKLEMSLKRETGIGRCVSALSLCNVNLFRNETDMDEDCEIRLFAMLMEIRQNVDAVPESYIFLFDINQWYKAQMPSNINHLQVSNSYASFVKLSHNVSCLDFNISDKTLRPFGYNFRNNVEELYYPSSIYFECDCLMNSEIIQLKHAGVQQEILDQLLLKSWKLLTNPCLVFNQCLQTNLRPFFWDNPEDYVNYSLLDQRSFIISILVENKIMSVLSACAEQWKNGTYVSTGATILHLVQCLWKHVMVVKQFADKLCVPLFDYSGTQLDKKNKRLLNHCLSQMECVKYFLKELHNVYGVHIINVDYSYRVYTLNLVTQYFKAVTCFLNYGLLPESANEDPTQRILHCDFTSLIQYANTRRLELGDSKLYLIDAIVYNEPKGNKLIEQWQHEGGEATKGMYPPSTIQCLLRIYLNSALSDQVKDFITIYFLIDVCSSLDLNVAVANRMCNFAIEFDVENKGLNTLCRASWLFDHDMFEEAIEIMSSNKEWLIDDDKSWDWFHWTVLKLLVFKTEYFWARFYLKLVNIKPENIDDHKFYINLQVMNNQFFDALNYIRSRPLKEKQILFEYYFDRCRESNKLKSLIEYLWELEEEELFYSYLKKFNDPESLTYQLLFLLQRGRYIEAIELNKSLESIHKSKCNDALAITSLLVNGFDKSIPLTMRQSYNRPPVKSLYKKTDIVTVCMNSDSKMFNAMDRNTENIIKVMNSPKTSTNSINLIMPPNNSTRKRSPAYELMYNEKRRKIIDDYILSPPNVFNDDIQKPIENQVLEILKTPLVEKTFKSPSVLNYSSILKTGSAKIHKRILSIKGNEIPASKTVLRFSLPGNDNTSIEQVESNMDTSKADGFKNDALFNIESSDVNAIIKEAISISLEDLPDYNSKKESLISAPIIDEMYDECEQMDISANDSYSELNIESISPKENSSVSMCSNKDIILLTSSDEEEELKEKSVTTLTSINSISTTYAPNEFKSQTVIEKIPVPDSESPYIGKIYSSAPAITDVNNIHHSMLHNKNVSSNSISSNLVEEHCHNDKNDVKTDDVIILESESEDEVEKKCSSSYSTSSTESVNSDFSTGSSSRDSDLKNTRYCKFKSHKKEKNEWTDDSEEEGEGEDECEDEGEDEGEDECEDEGEDECEEEGEGEDEEIENDEDSCCILSSEDENVQKEEVNSGQYDTSSMGLEEGHPQLYREVFDWDTNRELIDQEYNVYQPSIPYNIESDGHNSEHQLESYDDRIMYTHSNEYEENNFENHNTRFDKEVGEISSENDIMGLGEGVEEISSENDFVELVEAVKEISSENYNVEFGEAIEEMGLEKNNVEFDEEVEEMGLEIDNLEFHKGVTEISLENDNVEFDNEVEEMGIENGNIELNEAVEEMGLENYNVESDEEFEEIDSENDNEVKEIDLVNDNVEFNEEVKEIDSENDNVEFNEEVKEIDSENDNIEFNEEVKEIDSENDNVEFNEEVKEIDSENDNEEVKKFNSENYNVEFNEEVKEIDSENDNEEVKEFNSENDNVEFNEEVIEIDSDNDNEEVKEFNSDNDNEKVKEINSENDNIELNEEVQEIYSRNDSVQFNEEYENNSLEEHNLKNENNTLENLNHVPNDGFDVCKEESKKDIIITCSEGLSSKILENSSVFDLTKEIPNNVIEIDDVTKENNSYIISENEVVINSSIKDQENINEMVEHFNNTNSCDITTQLDTVKNKNDEILTKVQDVISNAAEKCPSTINDHRIEELISNKSPNPENSQNNITETETQSSQLEVDLNQSTSFLFGESYFYQQDIPDHKPMLLFGQVYSIDKEEIVVDPHIDESKTHDMNTDKHKMMITNKDSEVELVDEIQDILELESLPESNPDDNLNVHKKLRSLQPCLNETININENSQLQNIIQESETEKQISTANLMNSEHLNNTEFTLNHESQIPPMLPEEKICETDHLTVNSVEYDKVPCNILEEGNTNQQPLIIYQNTEYKKTTSKPRSSIRAVSEHKELNTTVITRSKRAKSLIPQSTTANVHICNENDQLLQLNNPIDFPLQQQSIATPIKYTKSKKSIDSGRSIIPEHQKVSIEFSEYEPTNLTRQIAISESKDLIKIEAQESLSESIQNKSWSENDKDLTKKSFISLQQPLLSKKTSRRSIRAKSEQPSEKTSIESMNPCIVLSPLSNTVIDSEKKLEYEVEQPLEKITRRSIRAKSEQPSEKTSIESMNPCIVLSPLSNTVIDSEKKLEYEVEQPLEKTNIKLLDPYVVLVPLEDTDLTNKKIVKNEKVTQLLPGTTNKLEDGNDLNSSRRMSLRRSVTKTRKNDCCNDSFNKTERIESMDVTVNKLSVSMSNLNEKINDETNSTKTRVRPTKSSQLFETEIIKRRTRAKSETNLNQTEAGPSNIFRPSEMIKDRQTKITLPRKTSKGRGESGCSKTSVPVRTVFALEQIPEEDSLNPCKNLESEHVPNRKSKFKFLINKSNRVDLNDTNFQHKTKAKTPSRRAKSMEPEPVPTLSIVKPKKPKTSLSVNLLLSDEENEGKNLMEPFKNVIKIQRKRSISESVKSRKKPKITDREESLYHIAESETESNESYQNVNELFTRVEKSTKIPMGELNSENDTSDDDSVVSKRVMTTSMVLRNSSYLGLEPTDCISTINEKTSSVETVTTSSPAVKEKKKSKAVINKQQQTSSSSTFKIQKSPKRTVVVSNTGKSDVDELPKRRKRNTKKTIQAPISPTDDPLSARRITRSQHLLLDKSLQSTSIIEHDETADNLSTLKPENKKTPKKIKQKKINN